MTIAGAIALLCFLGSFLTSGALSDTLSTIGIVAAIAAAVIGVSFAVTGANR